jgi:lysophospholipase L1-like esterase
MGVNALARFDRDVLSHPHADTVILMMGINDIGWPGCILAPQESAPSADAIIDGYKQLIARANFPRDAHHRRYVDVIRGHLQGHAARGVLQHGQRAEAPGRQPVDSQQWRVDGVIDFDAVTRDPNRPAHILTAFDSGDHLHPKDDGYKAMADSIDLKMLTARP